MKTTILGAAAFAAVIAGGCVLPVAMAQTPKVQAQKVTAAGTWHGSIMRAGIGEIRLELRIEEKAGVLTGVGANMDQGGATTPLGNIVSDGATLKFSVPASGAGFSGKWDAKVKGWVGEWTHPAGNSAATFKAGPTPASAPLPKVTGLDGRWEGSAMGMSMLVRIESNESGTQASMESPGQTGAMPIKILTRDGANVVFAIPAMMMRFDGKLSVAGDKLEGTMTQAGQGLALTLTKQKS
ncbi:MAG TPA: hypothetical protein VGO52_26375 [Hyphomonadaceae bacterium]|jgi:hypothetical protein|nr:hypothetical protein [Hyphomonadaceae bacterium]